MRTRTEVPSDAAGLEELVQFGQASERHEHAAISVGGRLVLGASHFQPVVPGKEEKTDEPAESEGRPAEARAGNGPAAGSRAGSGPPQAEAAAGAASHAVGCLTTTDTLLDDVRRQFGDWSGKGIGEREFEELTTYFPDARVTASSSDLLFIGLTAMPFRTLGIRFQLAFEVPHPRVASDFIGRLSPSANELREIVADQLIGAPHQFRRVPPRVEPFPMVPPVRAWARWMDGPTAGATVITHHRQPDFSICACMPHQWLRGVHPLLDYAAMTVCWTAKVLHETYLGWYPGRQHYPEWSRLERYRPDEFCGCGSAERYGDCHLGEDRARDPAELARMRVATDRAYFEELAREGRPLAPPRAAWTF